MLREIPYFKLVRYQANVPCRLWNVWDMSERQNGRDSRSKDTYKRRTMHGSVRIRRLL